MNALAAPPQLLLGFLCLLLLGGIAYNLAAPLPQSDVAAAPAAVQPAANGALPVFQPPASDSFAEINARPVFDRNRQPIASDDSVSPSGTSATPPVAALIGVIIDGTRKLAMVRSQATGLASSVTVGDVIAGWRVIEIDPDKVVLSSGIERSIISLTQSHADNGAGAAPPGAGLTAPPATVPPPPAEAPGASTVAAPPAVPDNSAQTPGTPPQPH